MNPTSKSPSGNFFEHFYLGQRFVHPTPRTLSEGDSALYIALTGARQVLSSADTLAHAMGYQGRIMDDALVFHIALGKTVPDISINAVANLGYAQVKFLRPVYAGDTLYSESTVIGLKQNSDGKRGVVYVQSAAINQNHETVMTWCRWVMVHKQDVSSPAPETVIPTLDTSVSAQDLTPPQGVRYENFDTHMTGGAYLWDDYQVGEEIAHPSGMTIDESDHTLATKLYQNPARLHFDASLSTYQKRLVFGGHIISLARALSYEGLENALTIAAINAGSHCNPSFAGDTIYAHSTVLDKWSVAGREDVGALRLRLLAVKNQRLHQSADAMQLRDGKPVYAEHVVLDLDYTVWMPRRS